MRRWDRLAAAAAIGLLPLMMAPSQTHAACGESTKFVEQVAGTNLY